MIICAKRHIQNCLSHSLRERVGVVARINTGFLTCGNALWQPNGNKKSDSVCFTDNSDNVDTLC